MPPSRHSRQDRATVKIVTYHYVRPLAETRFPEIKGLNLERFEWQLDHLATEYNVISMPSLIEGLLDPGSLPDRPVLLTFDDGHLDHFEHVFPLLDERGIPGAFYPVSGVIEDRIVLDINKIHFLLASASVDRISTALFGAMDDLRGQHELPTMQECLDRFATPSRWDGPEVAMVKRLLQRGLPQSARRLVVDVLFDEFVGIDPGVFWRDLYMSEPQIRTLIRHGMHVGSHGFSHNRLPDLSEEDLTRELVRSAKTLRRLGVHETIWTFCYPHGSWDERGAKRMESSGFALALALGGRDAVIGHDAIYSVPRVDTNQVPLARQLAD